MIEKSGTGASHVLEHLAGLERLAIVISVDSHSLDELVGPVGVDIVEGAAGEGREAEAEHGAHIASGGSAKDPLLQARNSLVDEPRRQPHLNVLV